MLKTMKVLDPHFSGCGKEVHDEVMNGMQQEWEMGQNTYTTFSIEDYTEYDDNDNIIGYRFPAVTKYLLEQGVKLDEEVLILVWW
tara:strand:- start:18477 stop:18731 length:255 start_codon:yes stop_codon:yes gene_type:complete